MITNNTIFDYDYKEYIDPVIEYIKDLINYLLLRWIDILTYILRPIYIILIIFGIIKYLGTGLKSRNRDILLGGIALMIFTEFILPILLMSLP